MVGTAMASLAEDLGTDLPLDDRMEAFDAFVHERRDSAVRLAYRLLGSDFAAAEDIAQNAFLRAYRALPRFRAEAALSTWFYRILVREVHRHQRWQAVRRLWSREDEDPPEPVDDRPSGDPGLRKRIRDALSRLSAAQREAFILTYLEGCTIEEAAAILGKASGTVKSHMHRALKSLRNDLADLSPQNPQSGPTQGDSQ